MSDFMKNVNHDLPVEEGFGDWAKEKMKNLKDSFSSNKMVFVDVQLLKKDVQLADRAVSAALKKLHASRPDAGFNLLQKAIKRISSGMDVYNNKHERVQDINRIGQNQIQNTLHRVAFNLVLFRDMYKKADWLDQSPEAARGDLSPEAEDFDTLTLDLADEADKFGKTMGVKGKIKIHYANEDYDDEGQAYYELEFRPADYQKQGTTESMDKEATQEALFQDLTGQPVEEMSDNAAEALAVASAIGLVGLGMGLFSLVNKGIDKLFGNKKSSSSSTKINRQSAAKLKQLGQQFMATQNIDANERRSAFNDAIRLLKQYYPKEYIKQHFGISLIGGEWNEPSDFYKGKINICDFAFIHSASQEIPGYEEIRKKHLPENEEDEQREAAKNKYHKTIREMLNSINKDLAKKYKGKYRVYCEEFDDYWDIYGEGDRDEGVLIIADVDTISRMKSYVKNHAAEESFTDVVSEAEPVKEESWSKSEILSALGILGFGVLAYKQGKWAKEQEEKEAKEQEEKAKKELEKFNKEEKWIESHPIDKKEHLVVYNFASKLVREKDNFLIHDIGGQDEYEDDGGFQINDKNSFVGNTSHILVPDCFFIDICNITQDRTDAEEKQVMKILNEKLHKKFGNRYSLRIGPSDRIYLVDISLEKSFINSVKKETAKESTEVVSESINSEVNEKAIIDSMNDKDRDYASGSRSNMKYQYIYKEDGNPVGFVDLMEDTNNDKNNVYMFIGINPKFRGKGIFTKLIDKACNWLNTHNDYKAIMYYINKDNTSSIQAISKIPTFKRQKDAYGKVVFKYDRVATTKESTEVIYEGWGVVFTRFAVKHNLPFAKKLEDKIWQWSETTVNKLISLPEFKSYIDREASTVFKEEVKKNKNLSLKITPDMIEKFEETYADEAQFKKTESRNCCFCQKVGLYYIGVFGDKSHIHGVWLLMSDVRNQKIFAKALPAPSEEEMKKLCFQG